MAHPRAEVEDAFAEFRRLGVGERDWPAWAALFTDDARYVEHALGTFEGRAAITDWIVATMATVPSMTFSFEWWVIDGDRIVFYIWNHLPDPAGGDARYDFPNMTVLEYAGDGKWSYEEDLYNPADVKRVMGDWYRAGGRDDTPANLSLGPVPGHAPDPPTPAFPAEEVAREFEAYRGRGDLAVRTGDWDQWADQFTEDARYLEHHYGRFSGREEIRSWIKGVMQPFPDMDFPLEWAVFDGNRVLAYIPNRLPDPTGGDTTYAFNVLVVLHYAGNGQWSYEEDCYNPDDAIPVIERWLAAGGILPEGFDLGG